MAPKQILDPELKMVVSVCARSSKRDVGLVTADWRKFFEEQPTAWVYLSHQKDGITAPPEQQAKAYITDVVFDDFGGFDYKLNLLDGWTEEDHLEFSIEPVYTMLYRAGKPVYAEIKFLEFVPVKE